MDTPAYTLQARIPAIILNIGYYIWLKWLKSLDYDIHNYRLI